MDSQGNSVQLHSFRGKTIVLEWTNADCPYTRLYAAKTTPHLFVIDKSGAVQYMGGIDSIATADVADIPRAEPYLKEAMLAVVEGNPVPHAVTKPYGCSIKY